MIHPIAAFVLGITLTLILMICLIQIRDEKELKLLKKYRKDFLEMRDEISQQREISKSRLIEMEYSWMDKNNDFNSLLESKERVYYRRGNNKAQSEE